MRVRACARVGVRACVRARMRMCACLRARAYVRVRMRIFKLPGTWERSVICSAGILLSVSHGGGRVAQEWEGIFHTEQR